MTVAADDPVYGRWFADHGATAALQRPDFHLYGTATSPAGAAALVDHLRTRLATPAGTDKEPACEARQRQRPRRARPR